MQVPTSYLGEGCVGSIADEDVTEAIAVLARQVGSVRTYQPLADEAGEERRDVRLVGRESLDCGVVKGLALDRPVGEDGTLVGVELVDAGREHRLGRRRD